MSENNYGAMMIKSAVGVSDDINEILSPGIYLIPPANTSSPDSGGGALIIHSGSPIRRTFTSDSVICLTSTRNGNAWTSWRGPLSRKNPFADIKADGAAAIAEALSNLGIDRIDQDSNETRIWSPDGKNYIFVQNGAWGAYSINSPAGTVALQLSSGGTGAKDAAGARANLGLGNSSTRNVGSVSGTVAAGDDSRITGAMQQNQNGNDIPDKAAFRSNIGLGSAATRTVGNGANQIPDMSFFSAALAINGWAKLPNGLIIQQGTSTAATPSSPDVLVNFPIPFPTGVLHIGEHDSNGGLSMTLWQLNNITRTAFYAGALGGVTRGNTTIRALATSTSCNWFAIGY